MVDYNLTKYVKKFASHYKNSITCTSESCPLFSVCPQCVSGGQLSSNGEAKIFFVFDSPKLEDVETSCPAVSPAGQYFRSEWLAPFKAATGSMPYLITHLVRSNLDRPITPSESMYCWDHFYAELMQYKPKILVGFGSNIYPQLYLKSKNKSELPDPDSHTVSKLRNITLEMHLGDNYKPRVFIGYDPSFILKSPSANSFFKADVDTVINFILNRKTAAKPSIPTIEVSRINSVKEALEYIDHLTFGLPKDEFFDLSFDSETENLNRVYNNKFLSWQFSLKPDHATFMPIDHPQNPIFKDIKDKLKLIAAFQKLLNSSPEQTRINWIVAHNAKFDLSVLYGLYKILPRGSIPIWDTFLAMHWLDENRKSMSAVLDGKPYSLKTLAKEIFDFKYKSEQIAARADGDLVSLSYDDLVDYGAADAVITWHLKQEQIKMAHLQPDDAYSKLERFMRYYFSPASRAVSFMECNGIHVSKEQLHYLQGEKSPIWNRIERIENVELQQSPEVAAFRSKYKGTLQGESSVSYEDDIWGDPSNDDNSIPDFNPNKKDQETAFYLDFLGLKPLSFSKKTKKATLNKAFLNHYSAPEIYHKLPSIKPYLQYYTTPISEDDDSPIFPKNPLQLILEYRELSKLGNTYLESISEMIESDKGDCIDNRVRASFHLAGTDTGRLCLRYDSRISVVGDFAKVTPPISYVNHGIPIKDVKVGDLVYCYDENKNLQIRKVLWQGKTGTKKLIRVHWKAGNKKKTGYLDLTPEHKVRLLDGTYKMAKDLKIDDRLLTLARGVIEMNSNKKNYYARLFTPNAMLKEHRFVYENVNGEKAQTVHHADGNSLNNHPLNLISFTNSEHTSEHLKEHWKNGVFSNRPTKGDGHYLWNNQSKFTFLKELAKVKGHRRSPEGVANKNLIKNSASFKKRCILFGVDPKVVRMRYDGFGKYISKGRLKRLLESESNYGVLSKLKISYATLYSLIDLYQITSKLRNHVVVKIEELDGYHDVYDLEVEDCHNFIANEICVHNSSSNPNLQNLPSGRSKLAKQIKNLFQAEAPSKRFPNGTALIQLDYKTAEVRWAAIFANDKNLIRLFNEARDSLIKASSPDSTLTEEEFEVTQLASDIHRRTASLMFGVEPAKVTKSQRQAAKSISFGLIYGMGVKTLAANNGWSEDEAQEKIDMFFSAFPQLKSWLDNVPEKAVAKGYVETLMGRRRRLADLYKMTFRDRAKADRLAMNAPIQGQSSDGGIIGMFTFLQFLLDNNLERRWIIQNVVHDSCLVQVPIEDIEKALYAMQHYFVQGMADYIEKFFGFKPTLPIECEIEVGLKYGDLTKWDGRPATLPKLLSKINDDAKTLWFTKKEEDNKPDPSWDLVKYKGKP